MANRDTAPTIVSREEAEQAGLKRYFTGKPCYLGHIAERYVSTRQCAECQRLHRRAQYQKNPAAGIAAQKAYYRANREKVRARANAYDAANPEKKRALFKVWYELNKEARAKQKAEERKASPDIIRARWKRWAVANHEQVLAKGRLRHARKKGADGRHTGAEIKALFARQNGKCASCSKSLKLGYHADHILPLSKGGSNWITNIQLLCPTCNQRKWAKDPLRWAREIGRLL